MTTLADYFVDQTAEAVALLQLMLKYDSHSRISAERALVGYPSEHPLLLLTAGTGPSLFVSIP